jgi:thioredoxin-like negative regulator of GroEL
MPTIDDGRQAVEQGNLQQARLIFEAILQDNKRDVDAWLGLAEVLTDNEDKRVCYENVLKLDKGNRQAKDGLRNLEPQANPFVEALGSPGDADTLYDADAESDFAADDSDEDPSSKADSHKTVVGKAVVPPSGGPPTVALVAMGLVLSVVVFAVGGGVVYVVLSTLAGP